MSGVFVDKLRLGGKFTLVPSGSVLHLKARSRQLPKNPPLTVQGLRALGCRAMSRKSRMASGITLAGAVWTDLGTPKSEIWGG